MDEINRLQQLAGIIIEIKVNQPLNIVLTVGGDYLIKINEDWYEAVLTKINNDPRLKDKYTFNTKYGDYYITQEELKDKVKNNG